MGNIETQAAISDSQARLLAVGQHCIHLSYWLEDPMEILKPRLMPKKKKQQQQGRLLSIN